MKIKYSDNDEISIEGSRSEFETLHSKIIGMLTSGKNELHINLDSLYDPSPYDYAAMKVIFVISIENSIQIEDAFLVFKGTDDFFNNFALNLPFGIDDVPYHVHYDCISFPQFLKEGSPEVVIEATS